MRSKKDNKQCYFSMGYINIVKLRPQNCFSYSTTAKSQKNPKWFAVFGRQTIPIHEADLIKGLAISLENIHNQVDKFAYNCNNA